MRNKAAIGGAVFLILLFLFCFMGPALWRVDPDAQNILSVSETLAPPSLAHPLGTDDVGRDTLARVMAGGRVSLSVGLASMLLAILLGVGIGAFAGYYGGGAYNMLLRFFCVILGLSLFLLVFVLFPAPRARSPPRGVFLVASFCLT